MIDSLTNEIDLWAIERDLHTADHTKQFMKITEEVGELAQALAKQKPTDEVMEEIGDVYVTLVILSLQLNLSIADCIELAYEKIEHRQGKMINGVYVKQEDITNQQ